MSQTWTDTSIWKALSNRVASNSLAKSLTVLLESQTVMPKIERILQSAGSSPKDFTLHDNEHSFRVAERMWEILPGKKSDTDKEYLSELDLTFMLLSAYLHDIGMTPEVGKLNKHFELFLFGKNLQHFTKAEIQDFQSWLDEQGIEIDFSVQRDSVSAEDISKANRLLTYYARHKHNDWSGQWIAQNLDEHKIEGSKNWILYLIKICQSHHYGFDELKKDYFNPVAIAHSSLHTRYVAMCLRVADVMEIDPKRTPEVILKHRDIVSSSMIYWRKDVEMTLSIENLTDGNEKGISIFSRPSSALLHRAVLETSHQIEQELKLCHHLIAERPLNVSPTIKNLNHTWALRPTVDKDIKPLDGKYEYIDGAFKPNTDKIMELLGGTELYGNPLLAIREILQNSFDAIKESLYYHQISSGKLTGERLLHKQEEYKVELNLEERTNLIKDKHGNTISEERELWLTCNDNGVGMNKEIIQSYFLVSGSAKRKQLFELQRKCKEAGIQYERTGKFGIGALSYFMIADSLSLHTMRKQNTGYQDTADAWRFSISNLQDFGELSKESKYEHGTNLEMRVKKSIHPNGLAVLSEEIQNLLIDQLVRIPCCFEYRVSGKLLLSYNPGWCRSLDEAKDMVAKGVEERGIRLIERGTFLTKSQEREIEGLKDLTKEIRGQLQFEIQEGFLHDGKVPFRLIIPYFKFNYGNSLSYFYEEELGIRLLDIGMFIQEYDARLGYNGVSFQPNNDSEIYDEFSSRLCMVEIDFPGNNKLNIEASRNHSTAGSSQFLDDTYSQIDNLVKTFLNPLIERWGGRYYLLNLTFAELDIRDSHDLIWFERNLNSRSLTFSAFEVSFPFIEARSNLTRNLNLLDHTKFINQIDRVCFTELMRPSKMVLVESGNALSAWYFFDSIQSTKMDVDWVPLPSNLKCVLFTKRDFSLSWESINTDSVFSSLLKEDVFDRIETALGNNSELERILDSTLTNEEKIAIFYSLLKNLNSNVFDYFLERFPVVYKDIIDFARQTSETSSFYSFIHFEFDEFEKTIVTLRLEKYTIDDMYNISSEEMYIKSNAELQEQFGQTPPGWIFNVEMENV
jgi:hypothetical protein